MKKYMFQLVSRNSAGHIVARFTEPMISFDFAAMMEDRMGGYDPNGNKLEIVLVEVTA